MTVFLVLTSRSWSQNQTATLSPIVTNGNLPYEVRLQLYDFGMASFPTLHSYALGSHGGKWVLVGGRTNGLHSLTAGGMNAFPPAFQNRDIWVIDPVSRQAWSKSLQEPSAGLATEFVDDLTTTNQQYFQQGSRLYVTGGYGFDRTLNRFGTADTLTAIDLPDIIDWVQNGVGTAASAMRQLHHPTVKVTGGAMYSLGGAVHMVFGQDFDGPYAGGAVDGHYTKQIRSFDLVDDGVTLSIQNERSTTPVDAYRRRDLNVVPHLRRDATTGVVEESLVALSGVFTPPPGFGIWTVPVEIDANGNPTMADPAAATTFKQGMNSYHSAKLSLYSTDQDAMHHMLFGGISYRQYDRSQGIFVDDPLVPFINQITSIVRDSSGGITQYLMDEEFPELFNLDNGQRLHFGANAELILADGVPQLANGIIDLDALSQPTVVGYIAGGLVSDQGNFGNTAASNLIFQVTIVPIPEPAGFVLLGVVCILSTVIRRLRFYLLNGDRPAPYNRGF
jgi:hypothetical protein